MKESLVYVSWGGTGQPSSVRQALKRAAEVERPMLYLAVLDPENFGDLDSPTTSLVVEELKWLLDAQLDLVKSQLGVEDHEVEVLVKVGDVAEMVEQAVKPIAPTDILVGAPLPAGYTEPDALTELLARVTGCPVTVFPARTPADSS